MDTDALESSLNQYKLQLSQVNEALKITPKGQEYNSLTSLKSDIQQLIDLTTESVEAVKGKLRNALVNEKEPSETRNGKSKSSLDGQSGKTTKDSNPLDDEYALFMSEMAESGAYDDKEESSTVDQEEEEEEANKLNESTADTNIEEELSSLEGMKCSTMYSHKWGGAPTLHNAMVCSVVRNEEDNTNFYDIKVRVMFTNPTHVEMVPCPYYLDGDCKFSDDQCRFSHGEVVHLSSLSEAVEPNFSLLKSGCRVLAKLHQTDEPTGSKSSEKYLVWHRAIVKSVDSAGHRCEIQLEHDSGMKNKGKNYHSVEFSQVFPLTDNSPDSDTDTESSLSDSPGSEEVIAGPSKATTSLVEHSLLQDPGSVRLGDWEKHTKGIGSKLMERMGYVQGTGLGPSGEGRLQPVPCRPSLPGRSLDHCMALKEHSELEDPLKVEKKLRRLQKKQEEREQKAYERAKEREQHNVFNVLNDVFSTQNSSNRNGDADSSSPFPSKKMKADKLTDVKSSTCKNLKIEEFNISEDIKRLNKDILKLKSSLTRNTQGTNLHRSLSLQLASKSREVEELKTRQTSVTNEQSVRKDKKKMTVF